MRRAIHGVSNCAFIASYRVSFIFTAYKTSHYIDWAILGWKLLEKEPIQYSFYKHRIIQEFNPYLANVENMLS
jgi:hypothetical protein